MALLEMSDIHGGYGGVNILNGVNIAIDADQIGVIVGPNGAGKSTTLKALFGLLTVSQGTVKFAGEDITNKAPEARVRDGLSFVPQEFNVFPTMSVGKTLNSCGTKDRPSRTSASGALLVTSLPSKATLPCDTVNSPNSAFSVVDLPAPFGPTITPIWSASMAIFTPLRMLAPP